MHCAKRWKWRVTDRNEGPMPPNLSVVVVGDGKGKGKS